MVETVDRTGLAWMLIALAVLLGWGCDDSDGEGGGGATATAGSGGTAGGGTAGSGGSTASGGSSAGGGSGGDPSPDLVVLYTHELEVAVNVDAPAGGSFVRWYGGLSPAQQGGVVTNVVLVSGSVTIDGNERPLSSLQLQGVVDELPAIQERAFGRVTATAAEEDLCNQNGLTVIRAPATTTAMIRLVGSSDQGGWVAESTATGPDVMQTCHGGVSGIAQGYAEVWETATIGTYTDLTAVVQLNQPLALDSLAVTSLVLEAEGLPDSYPAAGPYATPGYGGPPYEILSVNTQDDYDVGQILCPDVQSGVPPEVYLTYEGTADGHPFSGTAPAGQCQRFIPN